MALRSKQIALLLFLSYGFAAQAQLRLIETGGGSEYVGFKGPAAVTTNILWTLPSADGTSNQALATDGAGNLIWITPSGGGGGGLPAADGTAATPSINFTNSTGTGLYRVGADILGIATAGTQRMAIDATGNVGIATAAASTAKLTVQGAAVSKTNIVASGATVDLSLANNHLLKSPGASSIVLQNLSDGGAYTLIVADITPRTYSFSGCTNTYFSPLNGPTTDRSAYTILVAVDGANTECYVTWITGFN